MDSFPEGRLSGEMVGTMSRREARQAMIEGRITPKDYIEVIEKTHDQYASRFLKIHVESTRKAKELEEEAKSGYRGQMRPRRPSKT